MSSSSALKRGIRDLVCFIQNVNLKAITRGAITGCFAQLSDLINAAVRRRIDLDHIH